MKDVHIRDTPHNNIAVTLRICDSNCPHTEKCIRHELSNVSRQFLIEIFFRYHKYFSDLRAKYVAEANRKGCMCFVCTVRHFDRF